MLNKLNIKNFKCFSNTEIEFNKLTVLAGINSVGKSSVIQALLIARQTYDKLKMYNNLNEVNDLRILLNNEYCLQLGNSLEVLNVDAGTENEIVLTMLGSSGSVEFSYSVNKDVSTLFLDFPNKDFIDNTILKSISLFKDQFYYLNTERIGPRAIQNMVSLEFPNTGYKGEYTGYVAARRSDDKIIEKKRFISKDFIVPNLKKQIDYWLDYIIPGVEFRTEPYERLNIIGLGLRRKSSDTDFLNPNNLGFGVSYVLPIIVAGLLAEEGSMLIVENPEVHLHPSGQSRIGQFLAQMASAGVQVIVETHSEHVINGMRIACLMDDLINTEDISFNYFNLDEDLRNINVEHIKLNKHAELSKWPKGFLDQEQNDLRTLIQLRKGLKRE